MKYGIAGVVAFWLFIVGILFLWNLADEERENEQLAMQNARVYFQQIVNTRTWNSDHGGVYVPVSENVQPNPYLDDARRDVVTTDGVQLTKINPAYMTRQIAEIAARGNGSSFHITSLNPLRPENRALEWEREWLLSFEQGVGEQGTFAQQDGQTVFRYMAPLHMEKTCLQCHTEQGYKEGDIRGGISITIPFPNQKGNTGLFVGYGATAVAGVFFTLIGGTMLARRRAELLKANRILEKGIAEREELIAKLQKANKEIKSLSGIIPICMYCKEIRDDEGYWNRLEKFITEHSEAQFSHGICPKCMKEKHPDIETEEGDLKGSKS